MITLTSYDTSEQLHESSNSVVYRGARKEDDLPVVLKVLRDEYPSPEKMAWFKREYDITRQLDIAEVVDVYAIENDQHRWVMVLEDFGGTSVDQLRLAGKLDINEFLGLAISSFWCSLTYLLMKPELFIFCSANFSWSILKSALTRMLRKNLKSALTRMLRKNLKSEITPTLSGKYSIFIFFEVWLNLRMVEYAL